MYTIYYLYYITIYLYYIRVSGESAGGGRAARASQPRLDMYMYVCIHVYVQYVLCLCIHIRHISIMYLAHV